MKLRYALLALVLAPSLALAQIPLQDAGDPELVVNSPAVLAATISNYNVDIDALPRPPYALPDTAASILLGYSVFLYETPAGDSVSTAYAYSEGPVTGDLVFGFDAGGSPALGCSDTAGNTDIANAADLAGNIAFISRGLCSFYYKVANAKAAGAIGILIYNPADRDPDTIGGMSGGEEGYDLHIPAMLVPWAIGEAFFNELAVGNTVNITMQESRFVVAGEGRPSVDGAGLFVTGANPTSTTARLQVRTPAAETVSVIAYNMLGQQVAVLYRGAVVGTQDVELSVSNLPSGSYFVRAIGETFSQTQQITVVR